MIRFERERERARESERESVCVCVCERERDLATGATLLRGGAGITPAEVVSQVAETVAVGEVAVLRTRVRAAFPRPVLRPVLHTPGVQFRVYGSEFRL